MPSHMLVIPTVPVLINDYQQCSQQPDLAYDLIVVVIIIHDKNDVLD